MRSFAFTMKVPRNSSHARAKASGKRIFAPAFTVFFYGLRNFCCKTMQFCATPRECPTTELPSVRNAAQSSEMIRNSLGLN
jgi:hypothetical protein